MFSRSFDLSGRTLFRSSWRGLKTKGQVQRTSLTPVNELEGAERGFRDLLRPLGFTVLVSNLNLNEIFH